MAMADFSGQSGAIAPINKPLLPIHPKNTSQVENIGLMSHIHKQLNVLVFSLRRILNEVGVSFYQE